MKVIIDYLQDSDYNDIAYKSVSRQLEEFRVIKCANPEELKRNLSELGQFNEDGILTILSHGHERGLAKGTWDSLVTWCELVEQTNRCKGNHDFILNLLSVCNSNNIHNAADFCNHSIDEIWVTTNQVVSIQKALLALTENSFNNFKNNLDDEESILYDRIVGGL